MQQIPQQFRGKNGSNATAQTATMPQQKPQLQETVASNKQRKISPQVTWARKQGVNHPRKQQQQAENSAAGYLGSQGSKSSSQAAATGGKIRRKLRQIGTLRRQVPPGASSHRRSHYPRQDSNLRPAV
jgi:hypothetical protein